MTLIIAVVASILAAFALGWSLAEGAHSAVKSWRKASETVSWAEQEIEFALWEHELAETPSLGGDDGYEG